MNIVFTEDYTENQLVTAPDEIDEWISNFRINSNFVERFMLKSMERYVNIQLCNFFDIA